ncbi:MAG: hypothetical protein H0V96_06405 [Acidimicrobiia bacterium]|nr:hypothetical protein [Acidimicrobiia bacterium]
MGRWRWMGAVALAAAGTVVSPVAAAPDPAATVETADETELRPCRGMPEVLCGTLTRPLDPVDPDAGTIDIGFELHPSRTGVAEGTIVTVEGGPGYSSTASRDWYLELYAEGRLTLSWNDYDMAATATVSGSVDGEAVELTMPAP